MNAGQCRTVLHLSRGPAISVIAGRTGGLYRPQSCPAITRGGDGRRNPLFRPAKLSGISAATAVGDGRRTGERRNDVGRRRVDARAGPVV